jgi:hypothetical protein
MTCRMLDAVDSEIDQVVVSSVLERWSGRPFSIVHAPPVGPQVHDVKWFAFCVSICIQTMARS